jgi:hypothetical protein
MAQQSFIYNATNLADPNVNNPFTIEKSSLIRAAGLTEVAQVYFAVGRCLTCGTTDLLWEPLSICGVPVTLSADNNMIVLGVAGQYSIGDPSGNIVFTGDVNITKEEGVAQHQLTKPCPAAAVDDTCEELASRGLVAAW